jgi:adenylosuccinate lyase
VQELAQRAWGEAVPLRDLLAGDERASGLDLDAIFDYGHYLRYADEIIARLDQIACVRLEAGGQAIQGRSKRSVLRT